jgi:hypothetical protein
MPRVVLDYDPPEAGAPQLQGDTSDLVYFLSFAFSQRYGATHELAVAALVLRGEFKINIAPLMTFADRDIEESVDAETLERAWQDAMPLAECCRAVAAALGSDDKRLAAVRHDFPRLQDLIGQLGECAAWAATGGLRIRVTYELEDG